jgi:hypothetical protein
MILLGLGWEVGLFAHVFFVNVFDPKSKTSADAIPKQIIA